MTLLFLIFSDIQQDSLDFYLHKGLDALNIEEYENAKVYTNKAISFDTTNPIGYFAYTAIFRLYSSDFVTDSLNDSFFYYADRTIEKANIRIKRNNKDSWSHFFLGGVNMYISSFYIEKGNFLKSLGFAERSISETDICLSINPELYDAYLLKGSYEYLKGSFPLWGGYREKGIENVKIASQKAEYFRPVAKNILSVLLQREKRFSEAIEEATELIELYPESRTFLWTLSKAYLEKGDWEEAIRNYECLRENILTEQPENIFNVVQIELSLATAYCNIENYEKTIELCEDILRIGAKDERTKDMVKEAEKLYKKAKM